MLFIDNYNTIWEGSIYMEIFIYLLVSVLGGVACHYVIKWLDDGGKSNN